MKREHGPSKAARAVPVIQNALARGELERDALFALTNAAKIGTKATYAALNALGLKSLPSSFGGKWIYKLLETRPAAPAPAGPPLSESTTPRPDLCAALQKALDIDEGFAAALIGAGYGSVEAVAQATASELEQALRLDADLCQELKQRASDVLAAKRAQHPRPAEAVIPAAPVEADPAPALEQQVEKPATPLNDQAVAQRLAKHLKLSDHIANALVVAGFRSIEQIKAARHTSLASIEGLHQNPLIRPRMAQEIQRRAREWKTPA